MAEIKEQKTINVNMPMPEDTHKKLKDIQRECMKSGKYYTLHEIINKCINIVHKLTKDEKN